MSWRKIVLVVAILLSVGIYFLLFRSDKSLKYVPENADVVILVDTKKATRHYISSYLTHPSKWFESEEKDKISAKNSGIIIPDYLQIFHLKNSKISNYYTILELNDFQKFCTFLKQNNFVNKGKLGYLKDNWVIFVNNKYAVIGTSKDEFAYISNFLSENKERKFNNADSFLEDGLGSVSFISELRTQNFSIDLKDEEIEIRNHSKDKSFETLIGDLENRTQFLDAELDQDHIKKIGQLFNHNISDSISVKYLKLNADLEQINDTIVSYGYDDNFNEIEKVSYQKIVQPNYEIVLQSSNPEKTWNYFQQKKWINAQNQFTAIPFQPNLISQNKSEISIKSTRKPVKTDAKTNKNYIFVKNNPLLHSSVKALNNQFFKNLEYLFYGNENQNYTVKIKFKKEKFPLILR